MKRMLSGVFIVIIAFSIGAFGGERILRMATDHSSTYPTTVALRHFADLVHERTDGRYKIDVYDSSQLGDEKAYLEQLQFGAIDFIKVSIPLLSEFSSPFKVLGFPYLFRSPEHMWRVLEGEIGDELMAGLDSANIVGLGWVDCGSRNFYSKQPIKTVADMDGMKVRVMQSSMMMAMVESLGAFPTAVAGSEIYSALQTGVVDAAENNINIYLDMSHFEIAKYFIWDRHNILPETILCGKMTWQSFPAEDQAIIRQCVQDATAYQKKLWAEQEELSAKTLVERGVTITNPTPEDIAQFREKCQAVYNKEGAAFADIFARIDAVE